MTFAHTVLITSAAGHIGVNAVPIFLEKPVKLVLPTSNSARVQGCLPACANEENVVIEQGSLADPEWFEEILTRHQVDAVFLVLTGTDELMTTLNILDAMKRANTVRHLVYLSGCGDYASSEGFKHIIETHNAMHVLLKPLIERKLAWSRYPWTTTVLGPGLFWENDLRSRPHIMTGVFDEPLGEAGVSRVSTTDIATAARNAIFDQVKWAGKKVMIGSRKAYTGTEVAKLWSDALGKEVRMLAADRQNLDAFEVGWYEMTRDKSWGRDLSLMYESFALAGFGMTEEMYRVQVECLGREPLDYEAFVRETGKAWTA